MVCSPGLGARHGVHMGLTVGQLKKMLDGYSSETEVWVGTVRRKRFSVKPANRVAQPESLTNDSQFLALLNDENEDL